MSLFDSASLIVTPNGYKEDKLYSIKPTDGSGDLVVTRATTATRVNSEGLIEVVPRNLLTYSEQFDNAAWAKTSTAGATSPVVTANNAIAPNGTLTADKIVFNSPVGEISQLSQSIAKSDTNNGSFYIKAATSEDIGKIIGYRFGTSTYILVTLTADWVRIENSQTGSYGSFDFILRSAIGTSSGTVSIYLWGAQLVTGTSVKEYFPTTDRLDVPRLDYTNSSCPSILVEPQRTNLDITSQSFSAWTLNNGAGVTTSTVTTSNPYTFSTVQKLIPSATLGQHRALLVANYSATGRLWVIAKANGYNFLSLGDGGGLNGGSIIFDLSNGTISGTAFGYNGEITSLGNGWYKCSINISFTGNTGRWVIVRNNNTVADYSGDGTSGILIAHKQMEVGSYDTSSIFTNGSTVTRNADVISKTGISSLIGQTEGTIFVDFIPTERINSRYISLESASGLGNGWIGIFSDAASPYKFRFYGDGFDFYSTNEIQLNQRYKIALSYKNGVVTSAYINGVSQGTLTASTTSKSYADFKIATAPIGNRGDGKYKQVTLWNTALTNSELAQLTTI